MGQSDGACPSPWIKLAARPKKVASSPRIPVLYRIVSYGQLLTTAYRDRYQVHLVLEYGYRALPGRSPVGTSLGKVLTPSSMLQCNPPCISPTGRTPMHLPK